jgi:hypothetical protein
MHAGAEIRPKRGVAFAERPHTDATGPATILIGGHTVRLAEAGHG